MDKKEMQDCIITLFDLIGIKRLASMGAGTSKMMDMHRKVAAKINDSLPLHSHAYVWNDSVLLLSYQTRPKELRRALLIELNDFKTRFEEENELKSYAISVQGKAFSNEMPDSLASKESKAILLKTSGWAMANCFKIETELKKYRAEWYIDSRITKGLKLGKPSLAADVKLFPSNRSRKIYLYKKICIE